MKKFLLSLAACLAVGFTAMAAEVTDVLDPTNIGLDGTSNYKDYTYTGASGAQYSMNCANGNSSIQLRLASGTQAKSGIVVTKSPGTVKKIEVVWNSNSANGRTLNIYGANTAYTLDGLYESGLTTAGTIVNGTSTSYSFTSAASFIGLKSNSGAMYIEKISITWDTDGGTTDPDPDPVDPTPNPGDKEDFTFDFSTGTYGAGPAYTDANTAYVTSDNVATSDSGVITVTFSGDSQAWRFWSDGIRAYKNKNAKFTVAATSGKVTSVSWTVKSGATFALEGTTTNITSWTGSEESVSFVYTNTSSNLALITLKVEVEGGEAPAVAAPKISCENNTVTITAADGAEVYYTINGTEPSKTSTKYTTPFAISENTTVKAIAYIGNDASPIATYTAQYVGNYPGFEALVAEGAKAEGTVEGPITAVYQNGQYLYVVDSKDYPMLVYGTINTTLANGDQISDIKCTYGPYNGLPEMTNPVLGTVTKGGPEVAPQVLTAAPTEALVNRYVVMNNATLTSATAMTFAGESESVTLYKRFNDVAIPTDFTKKYNVTGFVSIFNGAIQVYPTAFEEVVEANQVETPVISFENNTVTITCATDGASIYYTTDGNDPEAGDDEYTAPFEITEDVTVKAIAVKDGMTNSYVATKECVYVNPDATEAMFNFANPALYGFETEGLGSGAEYDLTGKTITVGPISVLSEAAEGANNKPRFYLGTSGGTLYWSYRFYKDNTITISAETGYVIDKIKFDATNLNASVVFKPGTFSNNEWTPDTDGDQLSTRADEAPKVGVGAVTITKTETGNNPTITNMTVYYSEGIQLGVAEIEAAEEGEAVYFNLQGQRVNNPERGIFVKVVNGKATKVVK